MALCQALLQTQFLFYLRMSLYSRFPLQVIPTCVYLMSRIAVHMEIEGTAQCPAQVMLAAALGCEELGIANKLLAQSIFGLWMTSSLLGNDCPNSPNHSPRDYYWVTHLLTLLPVS